MLGGGVGVAEEALDGIVMWMAVPPPALNIRSAIWAATTEALVLARRASARSFVASSSPAEDAPRAARWCPKEGGAAANGRGPGRLHLGERAIADQDGGAGGRLDLGKRRRGRRWPRGHAEPLGAVRQQPPAMLVERARMVAASRSTRTSSYPARRRPVVDVVAAGAAQAADVPGVVDDGRRGRDDDDALLRQAVPRPGAAVADVDAHGEAEPIGVLAAAAVRPAPVTRKPPSTTRPDRTARPVCRT